MAATYDEQGNYIYPEGFDPETGEWLEGYDEQREEWESSTPRRTPAGRPTSSSRRRSPWSSRTTPSRSASARCARCGSEPYHPEDDNPVFDFVVARRVPDA
jgi:small subunit ribosomal protein S1